MTTSMQLQILIALKAFVTYLADEPVCCHQGFRRESYDFGIWVWHSRKISLPLHRWLVRVFSHRSSSATRRLLLPRLLVHIVIFVSRRATRLSRSRCEVRHGRCRHNSGRPENSESTWYGREKLATPTPGRDVLRKSNHLCFAISSAARRRRGGGD